MKLNCISIFHYISEKICFSSGACVYSLILWIFTVAYMINGFLKEVNFLNLAAVQIILNDIFGGFLLVFSLYKYYAKLIIYISEIINGNSREKAKKISEFFLSILYRIIGILKPSPIGYFFV